MKILIGIVLGAVIGFAIGYFGHCGSGTCPLIGNPWVSTILGGTFGAIIVAK